MTSNGRTPAVYDETSVRLWPDLKAGPWQLTLYWKRRKGRPELVGHTLLAKDVKAAELVTMMTSTVRELKIAELAAEERERLEYVPPPAPTPGERVAGMRDGTRRKLTRVAEVYLEAWRAGENPTKEVARRLNVTAPAAGNLVKRAREVGFLPPTSAGKPQG